ncbi:hypothetical protein DO021_12840 [Desulfobacter hydrogenophilus]|uniref:Glycosyltransferase n=1 Tax=Desulfobacter hydrogenophilus TaxID=2291 RepID=A0A328FAS8_9BACT|nr:glycosyltransferase [Desulfobacter hydrogenophilus]NDY74099.1 glycosyltransferase family 4 protein [Desulfobacter hydrogenophilus]QBH14097.1 glycosyltransferase [Desulfobacter hydrogenophilus]RAM01658.1 hypothetical protein DO021_12840 [Desulfobacter hydrogenophilus]
MSQKILLVTKNQFGYQTDYYKYACYLKNLYDITYFSFDNSKKKIHEEKIKSVYICANTSYLGRALLFYYKLIRFLQTNKVDLIIIKSFDYCFFLKLLFPKKKFILDLRSSAISLNQIKRLYHNLLIRLNTKFFSNITIISEGLAQKLHLKNYCVVPLGAEIISKKNKQFDELKLMYIGTLDNRDVDKTVKGVKLFLSKEHNVETFEYHIFGKGKEFEECRLKNTIEECNLRKKVFFHGYKRHEEIVEYFDKCNVGVSYVPITFFYDNQPPTKTFEYLLSGMACIATGTSENKKIIVPENGILCADSAENFARSLEKLYKNRNRYHSDMIRSTVINAQWDKIVNNILLRVIKKII